MNIVIRNDEQGGRGMKKTALIMLIAFIFMIGICSANAFADQEWIRDILEKKERYWNTTVTVVGQVLSVTADPPGTTRGTYQIQDESTKDALTVRTDDLPPVGKTYQVTGMILQDPETSQTYMKEIRRNPPGIPSTVKILLVIGVALFVILLIIFIVLLAKSRKKPPAQQTLRPAARPGVPAPGLDKTAKVAPAEAPSPPPEKTQIFVSLGAEISVEKGPDKGKEFTLHKQVMTIGRPGSRKNDIELTDDTVSKEQASIFYDNTKKEFTIKNESTTNPTMVNKNLVTESSLLENDAVIEMGKSVLKFKKQ
jgi:hypothetical protein